MKINGKEVGIGNKYKTINPLVLIARQIAKRFKYEHSRFSDYIEPSNDPNQDYGIWSIVESFPHYHVMGFPVYGDYKGHKFVDQIYDFFKSIKNFKTGLYYRFFKRMHKLTLRNIKADTWTDSDERMFQACFTILGEYVENELGTVNWYPDQPDCMYRGYRQHAQNGDAPLIDLWLWYLKELPQEEIEYANYIDKKYANTRIVTKPSVNHKDLLEMHIEGQVTTEIEKDQKYDSGPDYIEELKDKKLKELICLRRTMWT
jgi:hypothetical protein